MTRKAVLISLIITMFCGLAEARQDGFSIEVEWGTRASKSLYSSYAFITEEGFTVNGEYNTSYIHQSGFVFVRAAYGFTPKLSATLSSGWLGLIKKTRVIPVMLGGELGISRNGKHRLFGEAGIGIPEYGLMAPPVMARLGYVLRYDIGYDTNLEIRVSALAADLEPYRYDYGKLIPADRLMMNNMKCAGLEISAAIVF